MPSVSKPFQPRGQRTWVVTVRPGDGEGYQVALHTRDERKAVLQAAALTLEVEAGRWRPPKRAETLEGIRDGYRDWYVNAAGPQGRDARERSWRSDGSALGQVIDGLLALKCRRGDDVTHAVALAYVDKRKLTAKSIETVKKAVRVAKAAWNWAAPRGLVSGPNPWCKIPFPKPALSNPRNLSLFEIRKIFATIRRAIRPFTRTTEAIVALALYAGLRLGEIMHLEWTDLDWTAGTIGVRVDDAWAPKDREPRVTLFPPELRAILLPLDARAVTDRAGWIFPSPEPTRAGKPISQNTVTDAIDRLSVASGVVFTAHDLRRTFAGILAAQGVPTPRIRDYLGHASVATTEGYYLGRGASANVADNDRLSFAPADSSQIVAGGNPGGAVSGGSGTTA